QRQAVRITLDVVLDGEQRHLDAGALGDRLIERQAHPSGRQVAGLSRQPPSVEADLGRETHFVAGRTIDHEDPSAQSASSGSPPPRNWVKSDKYPWLRSSSGANLNPTW